MEKMNRLAQEILQEAKKQGADYAQCSVSESEKKEFNVDGGRFSLMRTLYNRNVTITVLKDQRKGTVQINRFDGDAVKAAVRDAVAAAESGIFIVFLPFPFPCAGIKRTYKRVPDLRWILPFACIRVSIPTGRSKAVDLAFVSAEHVPFHA